MELDPQVVELSARLTEFAARNTATVISTRVRAARAAKRDQELLAELEEIITELSHDRNELLQIAQAYREQLAGQTIAAAEVEYITGQLVPKLQEILGMIPSTETESSEDFLKAFHSLISVETLTILQLLGFNFKRAIGEPLTELVAGLIASRTSAPPQVAAEVQRLAVERELAYIELAKDEDAYKRLRTMFSSGESTH